MSVKNRNTQPTFSIIIPMKNAESYIFHALNSISTQNYADIEVLIIDDNSDSQDQSKSIVQSWQQQNPQIPTKLFEILDKSKGAGGARNIGLDYATGKYILFLDSDDQLNPDALFNIKNAIVQNPNTDIFVLGYQLTRLDSSEQKINTINLPAGKVQESRFFQIGVNTAGTIWNTCIKKSLFDGRNGRDKIRFKSNCVFEDLPTKVQLFTRNKKKIKSVKHMTHTQFSRPCKSITGNLSFKDMSRLIDAHKEIANLKPEVDGRDTLYINVRLAMMPAILSWFTAKCIRNKLDRLKIKTISNQKSMDEK